MLSKTTCPLGSECEEIKNNVLHTCKWFTQIKGINPQTGEHVDERACAISLLPMLLIETAKENRGQTAALESFRNEMVKRADRARLLGYSDDLK